MLVSVLASGSKGNSTLIKTKEHSILIDAGMNVKYLREKLLQNNVMLEEIDYIFLTHTHIDHVASLKILIKNFSPKIIITEKMFEDLHYLKKYKNIEILTKDIKLGNTLVESITTSHDTTDARGYIITNKNSSVVVITDTGYLHSKHFPKLKNKNIYVFESNHDTELLMHSKYPLWLQRRVGGSEGHLSNEESAFYLSKLIGPNTKKVILAHLSAENNTEELALKCALNCLNDNDIDFIDIITAKQNEATELFKT